MFKSMKSSLISQQKSFRSALAGNDRFVNAPSFVYAYLVGGGESKGMSVYYIQNWYGPADLNYSIGGRSGQVVYKPASVSAGVSYPVVIGNASVTGYVESSTAFGLTATGGTGSRDIYGQSPVTETDLNTTASGQYNGEWGDAYGGYIMGSGGAGSAGSGSNAAAYAPGGGGAGVVSSQLIDVAGSAPKNWAYGGPGYGEEIVYGTRYYYNGSYPYNGEGTKRGSGGNASGNATAQPGVLYLYYSSQYDDPRSITGTYTKYEGNGYKLFVISTSGSVTF